MRSNANIKKFTGQRNIYSEDAMHNLASLLSQNTHLQTLNLRGSKLKDQHLRALSEGVGKNKSLKSLNLQQNSIADQGAKAIALALRNNRVSIEVLNLAENKITDSGGIYLAAILRINKTLKNLDLTDNKLRAFTGLGFVEALNYNRTIRKISLELNLIECAILKEIQHMLGLNRQILTKNVPARFHEAISRLKNKNKSLQESTEIIRKEEEDAKEQLNRLEVIEMSEVKIKQNQEKKSSELKEQFARELRAYDNLSLTIYHLEEAMKQRREDHKKELEDMKEEIFKIRVENNKLENKSKSGLTLVQDTKCDKRIHIIQYEEEIKRIEYQLEQEREKCKLKQICFETLLERTDVTPSSRAIADPPSINLNLTPSVTTPHEPSPKKSMKRLFSQKKIPKSKRSVNKSSRAIKGKTSSSRFKKEQSENCLSSQKNEDTYLDVPTPIARGGGEDNLEWKTVRGGDSSDFSKALSLEESYESSR